MKLLKVVIFLTGGCFNQEKSMIFRQLANVGGCVQSPLSAQKWRPRISEFWTEFAFLREQQMKFGGNPFG